MSSVDVIRRAFAAPKSVRPGTAAARARIALTYAWRHGFRPRFDAPATFTELVQLSKLTNRSQLLPLLADKVRAKAFARDVLGTAWIIPTLWEGRELPERPEWPLPFVVKSRHGCNQSAFFRTGTFDWPATRRQARRWVDTRYGGWLDEWLYSQIPAGVLVEPFVGVGGLLPIDYKFYVFGGRVAFVQVHIDRERHHRWIVLDRAWRRVSAATADGDPRKPASFEAMIAAAEALAQGIDFVRVDLYDIGGRPLFGEMTFYPGSGLDRFDPVELDATMGALWLDALR